MKYVAGFLFSEDKKQVLLIKKNKPDWQKGFLNGVGGKIEDFDNIPLDAMIREFKEEAGLTIKYWHHAVSLKGIREGKEEYTVEFFYSLNDEIHNAVQTTDEELVLINVSDLQESNVIINLNWLIPLCLDNMILKPIRMYDVEGH